MVLLHLYDFLITVDRRIQQIIVKKGSISTMVQFIHRQNTSYHYSIYYYIYIYEEREREVVITKVVSSFSYTQAFHIHPTDKTFK